MENHVAVPLWLDGVKLGSLAPALPILTSDGVQGRNVVLTWTLNTAS